MNCSLSTALWLILLAIAFLGLAIALAFFWPTALPLFGAAALVAAVSFILIPDIKNALTAYVTCIGSDKCTVSSIINNLGQAASILSCLAFALAGAIQIAALAFLYSWFLSWLFPTIEAAVLWLVRAGISGCGIVIVILAGILIQAYYSCTDEQGARSGTRAA